MPKKEKTGKVVSDKMNKTVVVAVQEPQPHPKYGKYQSKTIKFKVHDENNTSHIGDLVKIIECRPLSKDKTWQLKEIIETAQQI